MLNIIVAPYEYISIAERYAKRIVKYLKNEQVEYSVYFSQNFDNLKNNIKEVLSFGENEFVVIGDDLVLNTVISCFKDLNKVKLGIVPTGKHDDFASYLGISSNPIQAIKDILQKNVANIDILTVNDLAVLNSIVVGASVEVYHQLNQFKIKNFISEKFAVAKFGNNFAGIELNLETKAKVKKETVFEMVIANGGYSKRKPISPLSNLQDGLFNVVYSTVANKQGKKRYIKLTNKGEHIYNEDTKQYWMNKIKITNPERKIKALIDGKIHNMEELNISIIEGGLKIFKRP